MCEAEGGWERRGVRGKPERPGHLGGGGGGHRLAALFVCAGPACMHEWGGGGGGSKRCAHQRRGSRAQRSGALRLSPGCVAASAGGPGGAGHVLVRFAGLFCLMAVVGCRCARCGVWGVWPRCTACHQPWRHVVPAGMPHAAEPCGRLLFSCQRLLRHLAGPECCRQSAAGAERQRRAPLRPWLPSCQAAAPSGTGPAARQAMAA